LVVQTSVGEVLSYCIQTVVSQVVYKQ